MAIRIGLTTSGDQGMQADTERIRFYVNNTTSLPWTAGQFGWWLGVDPVTGNPATTRFFLQGQMSQVDYSSRFMLQRNTFGNTQMQIVSGNGPTRGAGVRLWYRRNRANTDYFWIHSLGSPAEHRIQSTVTGSGTHKPIAVYKVFTRFMEIDNNGTVGVFWQPNDAAFRMQVGSGDGRAAGRFMRNENITGPRQNCITSSTPSGTVTGAIQVNNSSVQHVSLSDYRRKTNIEPIVNALNTLGQMRPRTYNWIDGGNPGVGFIAHEYQAVISDGVTGVKDEVTEDGTPRYQKLDYRTIIPVLVASLQELHTKVQAARLRLQQLKGT